MLLDQFLSNPQTRLNSKHGRIPSLDKGCCVCVHARAAGSVSCGWASFFLLLEGGEQSVHTKKTKTPLWAGEPGASKRAVWHNIDPYASSLFERRKEKSGVKKGKLKRATKYFHIFHILYLAGF